MRADITERKVSYPELDPGNGREVSPTSARQFKPVPIDNVTTGTLADCCVGYTQGKRRVGHISIRYFVGHISALIPDLSAGEVGLPRKQESVVDGEVL